MNAYSHTELMNDKSGTISTSCTSFDKLKAIDVLGFSYYFKTVTMKSCIMKKLHLL